MATCKKALNKNPVFGPDFSLRILGRGPWRNHLAGWAWEPAAAVEAGRAPAEPDHI